MELPVRRMRQITTTIARRIEDNEKLKRSYIEWQTRALSSMIVSTAQIDKAGIDALSKVIQELSMDGTTEGHVSIDRGAGVVEGEDNSTADPYAYIDEDPSASLERALAKNAPGSFESFMSKATGGG